MEFNVANKKIVVMLAQGEIFQNEVVLSKFNMKLPHLYFGGKEKTGLGNVKNIAGEILNHLGNEGRLVNINREMIRIYVDGYVLPRWALNQTNF